MAIEYLPYEAMPNEIETPEVTWGVTVNGEAIPMKTSYASNDPGTDLLLITGFGENYIRNITENLGEQGEPLAVYHLTYPVGVRLTPDIMEDVVVNSLSAVIHGMNDKAGRPIESPVKIAAHSIGVGEAAKLIEKKPWLCNSFSGAGPMGISIKAEAFGTTTIEQRTETKRRFRVSGLLDNKVVGMDAEQLAIEYHAGNAYVRERDGVANIRQLFDAGVLKGFVIGEHDPLCPPEEFKQLVNRDGLVIVDLDRGHDPLSSPSGLNQIMQAIKLIRDH